MVAASDRTWQSDLREYVRLRGVAEARALRDGLARDDRALIHAANTYPRYEPHVADCDVECACLLLYGAWKLGRVKTARDGDSLMHELIHGHGGPPRFVALLKHWDDGYSVLARREVLAELNGILAEAELRSVPGGA